MARTLGFVVATDWVIITVRNVSITYGVEVG